ncbi:MAG: winged helix-turn-helix domain-containing protein [Methanomassiliicoccales archaeon]|jgi:predicted transcriptional regulator
MSDGAPALRYRSKGRIFADILRAVKQDGKARPTHILYKANLSHDRLTKYLGMLEDSQLVTKNDDGDKVEYSITVKGEQFLVEFKRMEQFADAFGLEI